MFRSLNTVRSGYLHKAMEYARAGNLTGLKLWVSWSGQAERFPGEELKKNFKTNRSCIPSW